MKTTYGTILVLVLATAMLLTAPLPCAAVEKEEENIWSEDEPRGGHRWFELTDEAIERMMSQLAKSNPEEAEELEKLRDRDPEKFREAMRERFGKRFKQRMEQRKQRAGRKHRPGPDMPFMRPEGPGGQPKREMMRGQKRERQMREKHTEYIEWLEKNYPEEAEKLAELRKEKPELYRKQIGLSVKKYGRIAKASKENPELAEALKEDLELKKERDKLLSKIRTASDDEKEELVEELEKVIGSRFDLVIKRKQIRCEQLRKKLEELKEQVKRSQAEAEKWKGVKGEKVKERLEELISRAEKFNWH